MTDQLLPGPIRQHGCCVALHNSQLIYFTLFFIHLLACHHDLTWHIRSSEDRECSVALDNSRLLIYFALSFIHLLACHHDLTRHIRSIIWHQDRRHNKNQKSCIHRQTRRKYQILLILIKIYVNWLMSWGCHPILTNPKYSECQSAVAYADSASAHFRTSLGYL